MLGVAHFEAFYPKPRNIFDFVNNCTRNTLVSVGDFTHNVFNQHNPVRECKFRASSPPPNTSIRPTSLDPILLADLHLYDRRLYRRKPLRRFTWRQNRCTTISSRKRAPLTDHIEGMVPLPQEQELQHDVRRCQRSIAYGLENCLLGWGFLHTRRCNR